MTSEKIRPRTSVRGLIRFEAMLRYAGRSYFSNVIFRVSIVSPVWKWQKYTPLA